MKGKVIKLFCTSYRQPCTVVHHLPCTSLSFSVIFSSCAIVSPLHQRCTLKRAMTVSGCPCCSEGHPHQAVQQQLLTALYHSPSSALHQPQLQSDLLELCCHDLSTPTQSAMPRLDLLVSALRAHGAVLSWDVAKKLATSVQAGVPVLGKLPFLLLLHSMGSWPEGELQHFAWTCVSG